MRIFKPNTHSKKRMTQAEKQRWRDNLIKRLLEFGIPHRELIAVSDHRLWQMKNRYLPNIGAALSPMQKLNLPRSYLH